MSKKVLILENLGSDYGSYFLTRGFVRLLGPERVRMWPYKFTNEGGIDHYPERVHDGNVLQVKDGQVVYGPYFTGSELWSDRALWRFWQPEKNLTGSQLSDNGPVYHMEPLGIPRALDGEILAMVEAGEFGLVVLNGVRWHNAAALSELQALFGARLPPLAICDHEDYTQRRWDYVDRFRPQVYFKRSLLSGGHPHDFLHGRRAGVRVLPLPFSSMWDLPWVPFAERDIDLFCVFGSTQVMRAKLKEVALEVAAQVPGCRVVAALGRPMNHPEYLRALSRAKVVIDHQGYGTDTMRFWEAAAAGGCIVSDLALELPPNQLHHDVHYRKYDHDLSSGCDQQDFVRFRKQLGAALRDESGSEARARKLYDEVRQNHTNEARARYVLKETLGAAAGAF